MSPRFSIPVSYTHLDVYKRQVEDFAVKAMRHGLSGTLCDTVQDAVEKALRRARENDLIFIGGSTFIVADALPLFMKEDEYK